MNRLTTADSLSQLLQTHWPCATSRWFSLLAAHDLVGIDWPDRSVSREELLGIANLLARHRCPPLPESLATIAPIILDHCAPQDRLQLLARIRSDPLSAVRLEQTDDTIRLYCGDTVITVGAPGGAPVILAHSFSAFCTLVEIQLGISHLQEMAGYWDEPQATGLAELTVRAEAASALFLRDSDQADQQLALLGAGLRQDIYWALHGYLGYYALLDPDPMTSTNEPVPFPAERDYLKAIRQAAIRDERLQRDRLFRILQD